MASDLGLQCLPRSQKNDARLIWVKLISPLNMPNTDAAEAPMSGVHGFVANGTK